MRETTALVVAFIIIQSTSVLCGAENALERVVACEQATGFYGGDHDPDQSKHVRVSDDSQFPHSTALSVLTIREATSSDTFRVTGAFSTSLKQDKLFELALSIHDEDPGCDVFSQMNSTLDKVEGRAGSVSVETLISIDDPRTLYARFSLGISTPDKWGSMLLLDDSPCVPINVSAYCTETLHVIPGSKDGEEEEEKKEETKDKIDETNISPNADTQDEQISEYSDNNRSSSPAIHSTTSTNNDACDCAKCPQLPKVKMEIKPVMDVISNHDSKAKSTAKGSFDTDHGNITMIQLGNISVFVLFAVLLGILWIATFAIYLCRCLKPSGSRVY